jgi:lysophospholipase L1-like esterase
LPEVPSATIQPTHQATPNLEAQAEEIIRIMPLGDSITEGVCDQPDTCNVPEIKTPGTGYDLESCSFNLNFYNRAARGYREFLRDKLIEVGVEMTYVGSVQVNEGLAHEGHSAFRISDIDYCIQNADWLDHAKPDMILLHVGSADAGDGIQANVSLVGLRNLLTHIYQILPETTEVIVAQVIPAREDSHVNFDPSKPLVNDTLKEYNAGIPAIVEEFRAMGNHISLVDMRDAIQSADDYDEMGRHLTAVASERMAQVWFEKIKEILGQQE